MDKLDYKSMLFLENYNSNNRFAYYFDLTKDFPLDTTAEKYLDLDTKVYNFVPTYDKWCLYCNKKNVTKRCVCKTIYFCGKECQKNAWPYHKKHCSRDQFTLCCTCGTKTLPLSIKCEKCPVKFCSLDCKNRIYENHLTFDCENFQRLFENKK